MPINQLDQETKERINNAIANIRFIATRVKRASIPDAQQRVEIVVSFLNEFRQHVNAVVGNDQDALRGMAFRYDEETRGRAVRATFQADTIYSMLTRERKKSYEDEYRQVWNLLENIHAYLVRVIEKGGNNGKQ